MSDKHINPDLLGKVRQIDHSFDIPSLIKGIESRDRNSIAQAITLVESNRPEDQELAINLLSGLRIQKRAFRIVITGAPGVGKSTFINSIASQAIKEDASMAILATDPSSQITKGSILGDKTRMSDILSSDHIFVRPSASASHLGGATKNSLEKMDILHAAGFDYILLETVGVGQSEFNTYKLSDLFMLLVNPGGGDELQGMKRGIVEMADMICVNKYDGANKELAKLTKKQYEASNKLLQNPRIGWNTTLHLISAMENSGMEELWSSIKSYENERAEKGLLEETRSQQDRLILEDKAIQYLTDKLKSEPRLKELIRKHLERTKPTDASISQSLLSLRKELDDFL